MDQCKCCEYGVYQSLLLRPGEEVFCPECGKQLFLETQLHIEVFYLETGLWK